MSGLDLRKIYRFTPIVPAPATVPAAGDIYVECLDCTAIVSSVPRIPMACVCGNLQGKDGTLEIRDATRISVVRGKLK